MTSVRTLTSGEEAKLRTRMTEVEEEIAFMRETLAREYMAPVNGASLADCLGTLAVNAGHLSSTAKGIRTRLLA